MAPLFGQRQKAQEDSAASAAVRNSEQRQEPLPGSRVGNGVSGIESTSADIHYTSVSGVHQHSMNPHLSSGSGDGATSNNYHQNCNAIPPPLPPFRQTSQNSTSTTKDATAIRKYLVLLQDCLAIKFAPLVTGHQSHPYPFAFNSANNNHSKNSCSHSGGCDTTAVDEDDLVSHRQGNIHSPHHRVVSSGSSINSCNNKCGRNSISEPLATSINNNSNGFLHENNLTRNHNNSNCSHQHNDSTLGSNNVGIHNNRDPQRAFHHKSTHHHYHPTLRQHQFHFLQSSNSGGTLSRPTTTYPNGIGGNTLGSNTAEVDHSLHALYLYKGFKEANLQCYWNAALSETFRDIQYKGYIVPSTILVGALPKCLSILRTAWSRQMLRSPAGYRIEFIGEIEEVIADPIQKGQFSPLSDSLCWAILELTSLGQEAFVDSIMSALQVAFPAMSSPSRELVFQTLEKLIKERKVYQTSRGYFVVTPDIFRYMVSANFHEFDGTVPFGNNNPGLTLDALANPNCHEDKVSFLHQSWEPAADHNRCSSTSTGEEMIEVAPSPKLKRHNSLKLIRQRDVAVTQMSGSTGHRRHSLRLPKSKSCGRMNDTVDDEEVKRAKVKSSTIEHISRAMRSLRSSTMTSTTSSSNTDGGTNPDSEKSKKNKSLLSKLFPFRRSNSKSRNEKITTAPPTTVSAAACRVSTCSNTSAATSTSSSSDGSMSPPTKTKHSENAKESAKFISTQTQTSNSTEQLCVPSITLSATPMPPSSPRPASSTIPVAESNTGRMLTVDAAAERSSVDITLNQDCINGDGSHQTRSSSRRSMSILDESPLYDVLQDVSSHAASSSSGGCGMSHISPNFQVGCPVAPPTFPGFHHHHNHRGESSRCSTLSSQAASSLGYGSQGHPSFPSNYSPNLDSGLASYGYYGGDGSVASSSHSPSAHYGCGNNSRQHNSNNGSTIFPQPAKPTAYSSDRYKNSYEWYKKRYPNYISPAAGRTSPLYASLTAPRSKSRSRSTYDSLLAPMDEKHGGGLVQVSENRRRVSLYDTGSHNIGNSVNKGDVRRSSDQDGTGVCTTTVTQAVKSTTNMELELLLPLGKIMKAALHAKKDAIKDAWLRDELGPGYAAYANKNKSNLQNSGGAMTSNNTNENDMKGNESSIRVNLDNTGAKLRVGEPSTKTEVTTVVNNNGVIETHFDSSSGINQPLADLTSTNIQSTVAIKTLGGVTDVVLVNGKTGQETKIISTGEAAYNQEELSLSKSNENNKKPQQHQQQKQDFVEHNIGCEQHSALNKTDKSSRSSYEKILDKRSATTCVKISDIGKDCAADEVIKTC